MPASRRLPTGLWSRATASTRIAAHLSRAASRRLIRRSVSDDAALGDALFDELDQLKGVAMKVGQILSYMDVGLPPETTRRLSRLQRGAQPLAADVIAGILTDQLGAPPESLFDTWDPDPIAAASIGQVHRASLDGQPLAVKVRYPGVADTLTQDLGRLRALGRLASLGSNVDGVALVEELQARMVGECDYATEARWQRAFGQAFAHHPLVQVPAVRTNRCAAGVLTTHWADGASFASLQTRSRDDRTTAGRALTAFPYTSLLAHGCLQADPHPGNFLFPDAAPMVALDFGCVRQFHPDTVSAFRTLSRVVVDGQRAHLRDATVRAGITPKPDKIDFDALWDMMRWTYAPYLQPHFHFTRSWWQAGIQYSRPTDPNLRHQGLAPAWLWIQRMQWGLHAVLTQLDITLPVADLLREAIDMPLTPLQMEPV